LALRQLPDRGPQPVSLLGSGIGEGSAQRD
jgi:hypothetical protein